MCKAIHARAFVQNKLALMGGRDKKDTSLLGREGEWVLEEVGRRLNMITTHSLRVSKN